MINTGKSFNIRDYIEIFLRRIWYVIIPFAIVVSGAAIYSFTAPKKYRATTLILVTPQKVPVDYVRPTVTSRIEDRLQSIGQEIMSRTRLELVISEFKLYQQEAKSLAPEEIIELMQKDVRVDIRGREGYFTISYTGKDPRTVTMVTNKLASLFIEENLKLREQQAQGTTEFLTVELNATKAKLEDQEKIVTQFKKQFMYELPDQRDANLSILGKLQQQLQTVNDALKSAQDRKLIIQKQLTEMRNMAAMLTGQEDSTVSPSPLSSTLPKPKMENPDEIRFVKLKNHLSELEIRYKEKHPDILMTKKQIADLEKKIEASRKETEEVKEKEISSPAIVSSTDEATAGKRKGTTAGGGVDPFYQEMEGQLVITDLDIKRMKDEEAKIKAKISEYQARVENIPVRELAMTSLTRDYQNTNETYQSLLRKNQEAQQAENLERRQKGEQFKVVDPARIPEKPFSPNIPRNLLLGVLLGMGLGFGIAFFREEMDRSFKDAEDLETTLGFKVLANIPKIEKKAA
jgi:polysaccharide chain length determinant protein (PEP-CTERM system associated)